jgi:nucleoid DNA-binding protein
MKKNQLAARLARQSQTTRAAAADELDRVVHNILTRLRKGKSVSLPGLGTFLPGAKAGFAFEPHSGSRESRDRKGAAKP